MRAPGQAASTARSTRPGGTTPGTHQLMVSPASVAVSSNAEVGLPAERPSPRRTEQRHEIGPQGGRPLGVDLGRGEYPHQACPIGEAARLAAPDGGDRHGGGEGDSGEGRARGHAEMADQRAEVVEQPGGLGARVGEVAGEGPGRWQAGSVDGGRLRGGHAHARWPPCGRWLEVGGVVEGLLDPGPAHVVLGGAGEGGEGHPVHPGGEEALASAAPRR